MTISGLRHTDNFSANERPQNWREGILRLYPNGMAPLTALTAAMASESTDDPIFNWFEKSLHQFRIQLSEDMDSAETDLTVVAGALGVKAGDILLVENSSEIVFVSSTPFSDTSLTLARAQFGTSAGTVTISSQNPYLLKIGSAFEEGSAAPPGVAFDPASLYNNTQIFRDTIEATRTAQKTRLRTAPQKQEAKRECLEVHSVAMELALLFGVRSQSTRNGKPWRTTRGLMASIDAGNVENYAHGEVAISRLEQSFKKLFTYGSDEKVAFLGNTALLAINQAIRKATTFNIETGIKEYGMAVSRLVCPFGTLVLKTHPLFNIISGSSSGAWYALDSTLVAFDMKNIKYRYFTGDDTRYETALQIPGMDGYKEGYLTECGLEVHHAKTHYRINQMYTGVADGSLTP